MSLQTVFNRTVPHFTPAGRLSARIRRQEAFEPISGRGLDQRLFARAEDSVRGASLSGARVLLIGFSYAQLSAIRENLRVIGVRAVASAPRVGQLPDVAGMTNAFTHIIVNLDAFDDVESGVDSLLAFRKQTREFVVIACSASVGGDDFGPERAAICDATLRMPVSLAALRAGLATRLQAP